MFPISLPSFFFFFFLFLAIEGGIGLLVSDQASYLVTQEKKEITSA